ncbi:MAG: alginate export family protein [Bacteroidota bacterium]
MKILYKVILTFIVVLSFSTVSYSQLTVGAQIRPRAEFRNGFKTLTVDNRDAAFFIEQRSRLFADYNSENFQVRINFQDVRIWGATNQIFKTDPTLTNIYEGWGLYRFNSNWSFKLGRMPLDYDNARFLGDLDWAAQGRNHDAVLVSYKSDSSDFKIDAGFAFNQTGFEPAKLSSTFYSGVNNYKTIQFVWLHKDFDEAQFSLLVHNDGRQVTTDSSTSMRQTYGLIGSGNLGNINVGGEFFYQGGRNAADVKVNAFLVSAFATLKTNITPITVGFDYLSGSSINDTDDKSFNPLYGTNHKFYGYMDYFYVGNPHGQQGRVSGLVDAYLKSNFKINGNSSLATHLHLFNSAAELFDLENTNQSVSQYLGTELDLVYNLSLDKNVSINLGYSQMFAGESMELVKSAPGDHTALNNWVWFMINFNPIIFQL